jgi:hypothetical protein
MPFRRLAKDHWTQVMDAQRWLPQCGGLSARRRASFSFSA